MADDDNARPKTDPYLAKFPPELRPFVRREGPTPGVRPGDDPVLDKALAELREMNDGGDPLHWDVHDPGEAEKAAAKARSIGNVSAYVAPREIPETKLPAPGPIPEQDARRMPTERIARIPMQALAPAKEPSAGPRRLGGRTLELPTVPGPPSPPDDGASVDAAPPQTARARWPLGLLLVGVIVVVMLTGRSGDRSSASLSATASAAPAPTVTPPSMLTRAQEPDPPAPSGRAELPSPPTAPSVEATTTAVPRSPKKPPAPAQTAAPTVTVTAAPQPPPPPPPSSPPKSLNGPPPLVY